MLGFLNIRGQGVDFQFFQKLNPPPPGKREVKFTEQVVYCLI